MKRLVISLSLLVCAFSLYAKDCNKVIERFEASFVKELTMVDLSELEVCADNEYALDYLGGVYAQKNGPYFDEAKAVKFLTKSAQLGSISAKIDLAESYLLGSFTEINFDKAKYFAEDILKSKNTNNQLFAKYILAFIEVERSSSGGKAKQQIQNDLFASAKAGYKGASNLLLKLNKEKRLSSENSEKELLKLAARNGNMDAKFELALFLLKEKDIKGLSYIFELAHADYLDAQKYLVKYFRHKNERDSMLYWMKVAAKNGDPVVSNNYGAEILVSNTRKMQLTEEDDAIKYFYYAANSGVKEAY
ncbi:SEL1-like repeat protein [Kangiella sp. M94]